MSSSLHGVHHEGELQEEDLVAFGGWEEEIDSIAIAKSTRDDDGIITRLTNELSQKNAELNARTFALNHANLQMSALEGRDQESRTMVAQLRNELSLAQQDNLLLEANMRAISTFEKSEGDVDIQSLRGKLLEAANEEILNLSQQLREQEQQHSEELQRVSAAHNALLHENLGMREEVEHLCQQLATRTVMFYALTRQHQEHTTSTLSHFSEQEQEIISLKAQLQQLRQQYDATQSEKTEQLFQYRELQQVHSSLQGEMQECNMAKAQLEEDLHTASANNRVLQATVDGLRNADFDEVQHSFVQEIEAVRREARANEEVLKRQLAEARQLISTTAADKEVLTDEIEQLRGELQSQSELLQQMDSANFTYSNSYSQQISHIHHSNSDHNNSHQHQLHQQFNNMSTAGDEISLLSQLSAGEGEAHSASARTGAHRYSASSAAAPGAVRNNGHPSGADHTHHSARGGGTAHGTGVGGSVNSSTDSWSITMLALGNNSQAQNRENSSLPQLGMDSSLEGIPAGLLAGTAGSEEGEVEDAHQPLGIAFGGDIDANAGSQQMNQHSRTSRSRVATIAEALDTLTSSIQISNKQSLSSLPASVAAQLLLSLTSQTTIAGDRDGMLSTPTQSAEDSEMLRRCLDNLIRRLTSAVHVHLSTQQEPEPEADLQLSAEAETHREGAGDEQLPHREVDNSGSQEELLQLRHYVFSMKRKYRDMQAALRTVLLRASQGYDGGNSSSNSGSNSSGGIQQPQQQLTEAAGKAVAEALAQSNRLHVHFGENSIQDLCASEESTDSTVHAQLEHIQQLEAHLHSLQQQLRTRDAAVESVGAERDGLAAQLEHYREEVSQYEELAGRSRELGRHEAAQLYEDQLAALTAQLLSTQQQLQRALTEAAAAQAQAQSQQQELTQALTLEQAKAAETVGIDMGTGTISSSTAEASTSTADATTTSVAPPAATVVAALVSASTQTEDSPLLLPPSSAAATTATAGPSAAAPVITSTTAGAGADADAGTAAEETMLSPLSPSFYRGFSFPALTSLSPHTSKHEHGNGVGAHGGSGGGDDENDSEVSSVDLDELQEELMCLEKSAEHMVEERDALKHEAEDRETHLCAQIDGLTQQLSAAQESQQQTETRFGEYVSQCGALQETVSSLEAHILSLSQDLAAATETNNNTAPVQAISVSAADSISIDAHHSRVAELEQQHASAMQALTSLHSSELSTMQSSLRQQAQAAASAAEELSQELAQAKRKCVEVSAELLQSQKRCESLQATSATLESQLQELRRQLDSVHQELGAANVKISTLSNSSSSTVDVDTPMLGSPHYVDRAQFQDTVASLQIQMEAVKNINTLVAENIREKEKVPREDREAAEREMNNLRVSLEEKIMSVNEQIGRLREQQLLQQQQYLVGTHKDATESPEDRVVPLSVVETLRSEHQHLTHQLHARIAELEATNNHLIEKNMALVEVVQSSAQRQQQLHYEGAVEEKEKEKDNMSVFSMDKSTYQNQITLMAQHSAELDQQRQQIEIYKAMTAKLEQQVAQQRSYYKAKIARQRDAVESKLQAQQEQFNTERAHIVELVNEECGRIVKEVYDLLQQRSLEGQPMPPLPAHLYPPQSQQQQQQQQAQETPPFPHAPPVPDSVQHQHQHYNRYSSEQSWAEEHKHQQPTQHSAHPSSAPAPPPGVPLSRPSQQQSHHHPHDHQQHHHQHDHHQHDQHQELQEHREMPVLQQVTSVASPPRALPAKTAARLSSATTASATATHSSSSSSRPPTHPTEPSSTGSTSLFRNHHHSLPLPFPLQHHSGGNISGASASSSAVHHSVTTLHTTASAHSANTSTSELSAQVQPPKPSYANPTFAYTSKNRSAIGITTTGVGGSGGSGGGGSGGALPSGSAQVSNTSVSRKRSGAGSGEGRAAVSTTSSTAHSGRRKSSGGSGNSSRGTSRRTRNRENEAPQPAQGEVEEEEVFGTAGVTTASAGGTSSGSIPTSGFIRTNNRNSNNTGPTTGPSARPPMQMQIYPEMLSPEQTRELADIRRSLISEDYNQFRESQEHQRRSFSSSSFHSDASRLRTSI